MSSTGIRILDAASMAALARAVGISRQALYLHFPDRTQLLLAVMAHAGEQQQLEAGTAAVSQALADTRHADAAAAAAWADRTERVGGREGDLQAWLGFFRAVCLHQRANARFLA